MGIRFEEEQLRDQLSALPRPSRIAFAAACAARLENTARNLTIDDRLELPLSRAIGGIVAYLECGSPFDTKSAEKDLLLAIPDEDANPDFPFAVAEDAAAAAVFALRAMRSDDTQDVAWAARRAYDTSDREALGALNVGAVGESGERYVLHHPIVQRELQRQLRDLEAVSGIDSDTPAALTAVVARARSENILGYDL